MKEASNIITKLQGIENNNVKNNVRFNVVNQAMSAIRLMRESRKGNKPFVVVTLPSYGWKFESMLNNAIDTGVWDYDKPVLDIYGVEKLHTVANEAIKLMPDNCKLVLGELEDFLTKPSYYSRAGLGRVTGFSADTPPPKADIVWFDYCSNARNDNIKSFVKYLSTMPMGLAYITFSIGSRIRGGTKAYTKKLTHRGKATNQKEAILNTIAFYMRRYCSDQNITLILDCKYNGGPAKNTAMVTLGFSVGSLTNNPMNNISPIDVDYSVNLKSVQSRRYALYYSVKHKRNWCRRSRKEYVKKDNITTLKLRKAAAMYEGRWGDLCLSAKRILAIKLGVKLRQLSASIAQYHGKLRARNGIHNVAEYKRAAIKNSALAG
jgi:hypothetical protein